MKKSEKNTEKSYTVNSDINFDAVPQKVKDRLAAATLAEVRKFIAQPGGREILLRKYEEIERRKKQFEAAK